MNRRAILILAGAPLLLILALLVLTNLPASTSPATPRPPATSPATPNTTVTPNPTTPNTSATPNTTPAPNTTATPNTTPAPPAPLDPAAVSSPQSTVASSLRFLEADDELRFRQTLLPSVAAKLTPETFADCRAHLARGPVTPDWEVAERTVQDGHLVVRVSMFGKSLTGFHELRGRWLADALWCGLPQLGAGDGN